MKSQFNALLLSIFALTTSHSQACSMFKFTEKGKTFVGSNEDSWRTEPHIWFEQHSAAQLACAFTGSRSIGEHRFAAQAGMNEAGICYVRLSSWHPLLENHPDAQKPEIANPDVFLMDVLRTCRSLQDIREMYEKFNRRCFLHDIFVYVDREGNYLQVEPYKILEGKNSWMVQANFCPSITPEADRKQTRYVDGVKYFRLGLDTTFEFCKGAFEEMHVCREKLGDGTLLSSLWNPVDGKISLFFYHDYTHVVHFDFKEMTKENQQISTLSLFPPNKEFKALKDFVTPFNTDWIRVGLALIGMFLLTLSGGLVLVVLIHRKKTSILFYLASAFLCVYAFFYCFLLTTDEAYFYSPLPYTHPLSGFWTLVSWFPYIAVPLFILLLISGFREPYYQRWTWFGKVGLLFGTLALMPIFVGIFYWQLF